MDAQILLEETSPHDNVEAVVEQDHAVAYFYLRGGPETEFGVRACWVRNLVSAPLSLDVGSMQEGRAPLLPRDACNHPEGGRALTSESLRIVWLEEGDGAALLSGDDILAIIPAWSGSGGFNGYARDCTAETEICWPLGPGNSLLDRVRRSDEYWSLWGTPDSPWKTVQETEMAAYERQLGRYDKYFGIDGGAWPPKALVRIPLDGKVVLITIGICIRPQPAVELATGDPGKARRFELAMALSPGFANRFFEPVARYITGQASLPWSRMTWLGHGHTIPCDAFKDAPFVAVLLVAERLGVPAVQVPPFRGDPVNIFWLIPLTRSEHDFALEHGSEELLERLERGGIGCLAASRRPVV